jgi:hypothetical protein
VSQMCSSLPRVPGISVIEHLICVTYNWAMRQWLVRIAKLSIWIIACLVFMNFVTFAVNNPFAIEAPWVSGDANNRGDGVMTNVGYYHVGFPISYYTGSTTGSVGLVRAINILFAASIFFLLGLLLIKRTKIGLALCILVLFIGIASYISL